MILSFECKFTSSDVGYGSNISHELLLVFSEWDGDKSIISIIGYWQDILCFSKDASSPCLFVWKIITSYLIALIC